MRILAYAVVLSLVAFSGHGQESATKPASKPASKPAAAAHGDPEAMMARWMEMMQPGPQHAHFQEVVGTWNTTTKVWMAPGAAPMTSQGTCTFEVVMDGRYLMQKCEGQMMGMPFMGMGIEGYDNFKKKFVSTWIDSMGTGISMMSGTCNDDMSRCFYFGEMDEPMTGEVGKPIKATFEQTGDDESVFEMFDSSGGEWRRVMQITYKRAE